MQILFLNPCAQLGGAERCLLDTLASLRLAEPTWTLQLIASEDGPLLADARDLGVHAECLPFPTDLAQLGTSHGDSQGALQPTPLQLAIAYARALPALLIYRARLRQAIRRIAPDIIHTNGLKMHLLAAWNERRAPVIWHLHDYLSSRGMLGRALQLSASRCAGVVAISQSIAADAERVLGPSVVLKTILNGVDLQRFHPSGPRLDLGEYTRPTVRIGLIATFARWKGHEVFLRALAHPAVRKLSIQAYVIGGPIYRTAHSQHSMSELTELASELGVRDRVTFTGFLPDSAASMRALDIVVHASTKPEPFGLVIAEAMACGRPVIAADAGGAAEVLAGHLTGIGTPPGDVEELAAAIVHLTRDGISRLRMGRAARIAAETRFDRDRLGPALASFYRELLPRSEFSKSTAATSTVG